MRKLSTLDDTTTGVTRNILLTSLDVLGSDRDLQYYSVHNEFGCSYCEAVQSMEASSKYILSRFPIHEILVIGEDVSLPAETTGRLSV